MARKLAVAAGGPLNLLPRSELSTFNHQAEALRAPLRQGCVLCFDGLGNDWGVAGADGGTDPALEPPLIVRHCRGPRRARVLGPATTNGMCAAP